MSFNAPPDRVVCSLEATLDSFDAALAWAVSTIGRHGLEPPALDIEPLFGEDGEVTYAATVWGEVDLTRLAAPTPSIGAH